MSTAEPEAVDIAVRQQQLIFDVPSVTMGAANLDEVESVC